MRLGRQFVRFAIIGAGGFVVDVGVLYLLLAAGADHYSARLVSFAAAATATWLGNRCFTFASGRLQPAHAPAEWLRYLLAMSAGGAVNYAVYAVLILSFYAFGRHPWLAVAAGTGAGMLLNFILARRLLYRAA